MSQMLHGWELRSRGGWSTIDCRLSAYNEDGQWYIGAYQPGDRKLLYDIGWPSVLEPCGYNLREGIEFAAGIIGCSTRLCRGRMHQYDIVGTLLRLRRVHQSPLWELCANTCGRSTYLWKLYTTVGQSQTGTRQELLELLTELQQLDDGRDELNIFTASHAV